MSLPGHSPVSTDDYSSIVIILSWLVGVTVSLCVAVKIVMKFQMVRNFVADDAAIAVSLVFSLATVAAVIVQGYHGLGRRQEIISPEVLVTFQKATYAANITYIATLVLSKCSILIILRSISSTSLHRVLVYTTAGTLMAWSITSIIVVAFGCSVPRVWAILSDECIHQYVFWTYFAAVNILSEIVLTSLPALVISQVHVPPRKKISISALFATRVIVIAPIAAELFYIRRTTADYSFTLWPVFLCRQTAQCLSIVTACIPYLRPFFVSLESGMIRVDDTRRRRAGGAGYYYNNSNPHNSSEASKNSKKSKGHSTSEDHEMGPVKASNRPWGVYNTASAGGGDDEGGSLRSTSRIIRATTTVEMHTEQVEREEGSD